MENSSAKAVSLSLTESGIRLTWLCLLPVPGVGSQQHQGRQDRAQGGGSRGGGLQSVGKQAVVRFQPRSVCEISQTGLTGAVEALLQAEPRRAVWPQR